MQEYLFSYGTLQKEEVQLKLFGRLLNGTSDILEGYKVVKIEICDEAFLAKGEDKFQKTVEPTGICGDFIEGTVFEVSEDELRIVDAYEPENFHRIKIKLSSGKNAWLFIVN